MPSKKIRIRDTDYGGHATTLGYIQTRESVQMLNQCWFTVYEADPTIIINVNSV